MWGAAVTLPNDCLVCPRSVRIDTATDRYVRVANGCSRAARHDLLRSKAPAKLNELGRARAHVDAGDAHRPNAQTRTMGMNGNDYPAHPVAIVLTGPRELVHKIRTLVRLRDNRVRARTAAANQLTATGCDQEPTVRSPRLPTPDEYGVGP
jgi:hypothetical protein